jgi:membrane-associated phospholipid phosphatase
LYYSNSLNKDITLFGKDVLLRPILWLLYGVLIVRCSYGATNDSTHYSPDSLAVAPILKDSLSFTEKNEFLPDPLDCITNLPGDWWGWTKQTFTPEQVPMLFGLGYSTAVLVATDYQTWQPFKKAYDQNPAFHKAADFFAYLGDGKVQFGIAAAYAFYGVGFGDSRALRTASQTVEGILATGGVIQLLKHLTGRESPFVATTPTGRWDLLPNQVDYAKHVPHYDAFPSGHIATATSTVVILAENYPEYPWIKWVGYPILAGISVGLVATSIHWWSDIPLGFAIGYSFGKLVANPQISKTVKPGEMKSSIGMTMMRDGSPGLRYELRW